MRLSRRLQWTRFRATIPIVGTERDVTGAGCEDGKPPKSPRTKGELKSRWMSMQ